MINKTIHDKIFLKSSLKCMWKINVFYVVMSVSSGLEIVLFKLSHFWAVAPHDFLQPLLKISHT